MIFIVVTLIDFSKLLALAYSKERESRWRITVSLETLAKILHKFQRQH